MKNYLKFALSVIFAFILSHSIAYAQMYSEKGYITSLQSNTFSRRCFLGISKASYGNFIQGGYWDCSRSDGINMFDIAKHALHNVLPVLVTFEKNRKGYKPVRAVEVRKFLY